MLRKFSASQNLFYLTLMAFLSLVFWSCTPLKLQDASDSERQSISINSIYHLSDWLGAAQNGLHAKYGIETVYIGGGSSRAILDYYYQRAKDPLTMRDFDVFAVANKNLTYDIAHDIGESVAKDDPTVGVLSVKDIRPRPRANPALPIPERYSYNAGYGLFWLRDGEMLDLSLYHSNQDLNLNGIFDVDTVMIPLHYSVSLASFFHEILPRFSSYESLVESGLVHDTYGGYSSWRNRDPKVVHWAAIESDPMLGSIRVVRTWGKVGVLTPDKNTKAKLQQMISAVPCPANRLQIVRNLLKLLEDKAFSNELLSLRNVGFFTKWQPSLGRVLAKYNESSLSQLVQHCGDAVCRLNSLIKLTLTRERGMILSDIKLVDPKLTGFDP